MAKYRFIADRRYICEVEADSKTAAFTLACKQSSWSPIDPEWDGKGIDDCSLRVYADPTHIDGVEHTAPWNEHYGTGGGIEKCAYCGQPITGVIEYGIHRDGMGRGPELPLCMPCGSGDLPSCEQIWARISKEP